MSETAYFISSTESIKNATPANVFYFDVEKAFEDCMEINRRYPHRDYRVYRAEIKSKEEKKDE